MTIIEFVYLFAELSSLKAFNAALFHWMDFELLLLYILAKLVGFHAAKNWNVFKSQTKVLQDRIQNTFTLILVAFH